MKTHSIIASLAATLLLGCASVPPAEQLNREMVGVSGKSPLFSSGYRDGCQSGLSAARRLELASLLAEPLEVTDEQAEARLHGIAQGLLQ